MRGARGWILGGVVAILVALAAYVAQPASDSPEHGSSSDAANGTSAARLFAQAMGHPVDQIAGNFSPPAPPSLMFVFTPASYSPDEAAQTVDWVRSGGTLVYASESGDRELDSALSVTRLTGYVPSSGEVGNPVIDGVNQVAGAGFLMALDPAPGQVPILRTGGGAVTGYEQPVGSGKVIVLSDPLVLCNAYLEKLDNGQFLADLLGTVQPNAVVAFDEYHHGLVLSSVRLQPWVTTPWGAALVWLLVAVFAGLVLRGRAFGPLIPRPAESARSDVEWSVAVGQMLRRSSARSMTLGLLTAATERRVAEQTGLPVQPRERFWNALWMRAPTLAAELASAESELNSSAGSDRELIKAARRLHHLAYPVNETNRGGDATRES
ncbi:MAG: DUF4350 domain-containing protein [Candidatus Dormibacterales bacterium]